MQAMRGSAMHRLVKIIRFTASAALIWSLGPSAIAQTSDRGPVRAVLALGRVPSMIDTPMSIRLSRVLMPPGAAATYSSAHRMVYVLSGVITVTIVNDQRVVRSDEGAYLPPAADAVIKAGVDAPVELIQYELVRTMDAQTPGINSQVSVKELHQMKIPVDALKAGPHEFSMIRVTIPAGAARPRPHTRSGVALYYVLAEGTISIWPNATVDALSGESRTEPRRVGDVQEEPYGFIHSWAPKDDAALVLLQANISHEGVPEIIFVK